MAAKFKRAATISLCRIIDDTKRSGKLGKDARHLKSTGCKQVWRIGGKTRNAEVKIRIHHDGNYEMV
jgi:hypothetical protein